MPSAVVAGSARTVVGDSGSNAHTSRPKRYNDKGVRPKPHPLDGPIKSDQVAPVIFPRRARLRTVMLPYAVISA